MSLPLSPLRGSSKANNSEVHLELDNEEDKNKESLTRKMEEFSKTRKTLQIEQQRLDAKSQANGMDFPTFSQLQNDVILRIETLMAEKWDHNIQLRELEVHAGKAPALGPDYNFALEAIMHELYIESPGSKRSRNRVPRTIQSKMHKEAMAAYAPWLGAPMPGKSRCCITGENFDTEGLRCGHIVPRFLSENLVGYLVGVSPSRHLRGWYNSLMMCANAESRFEGGQFVLIPVEEGEFPITRWKVWVLDYSAGDSDMGRRRLMDFHDKEISFSNANRPATRFVFAHYALSVMRTVKWRIHRYEDRLRELADIRPFRMPGKYLRKSFALALWDGVNASHLGHSLFANVIPDAALFEDLVQMTSGEEDEAARRALVAAPESAADDDDYEDEEDEDEDRVDGMARSFSDASL